MFITVIVIQYLIIEISPFIHLHDNGACLKKHGAPTKYKREVINWERRGLTYNTVYKSKLSNNYCIEIFIGHARYTYRYTYTCTCMHRHWHSIPPMACVDI